MIYFWLKESFKLIGRAKGSFFISLISMTISVFLIITSFILIRISDILQSGVKESITINIFLNDSISKKELKEFEDKLNEEDFTKQVKYISKEMAAENFIKETGEDFRKILDYNPLPASFSVSLKENFVNQNSIQTVVKKLNKYPNVDEVVFQDKFVYTLLSYLDNIKKYIFIFTGILFFISIYIVYSTVKLITNSKYEEMETMKLVGAKLSTIKAPVILNSIYIGFFAGIIASGIFLALIYYINNNTLFNFLVDKNLIMYIAVLLIIGPLISACISVFTLRKISLKI